VEACFLKLEPAFTTSSLQRELELVMADRDLGRRNPRWAPRQCSTRGEKAVAGEGEEAAAGAGERAVTGDCERRKWRGER